MMIDNIGLYHGLVPEGSKLLLEVNQYWQSSVLPYLASTRPVDYMLLAPDFVPKF